MKRLVGTITVQPKPGTDRVFVDLRLENGDVVQCVSGPGLKCPALEANQKVSLTGDWPTDLIAKGNSPFFSFDSLTLLPD
jgi:hypothetical protein